MGITRSNPVKCVYKDQSCSKSLCENESPPICSYHAYVEGIVEIKNCSDCETPIFWNTKSKNLPKCESCEFKNEALGF